MKVHFKSTSEFQKKYINVEHVLQVLSLTVNTYN